MRLALVAALAAGLMSAAALADPAPPRALLLELWINGRTQHQVVPVIRREGGLLVARGDLLKAGFALPQGDGLVALSSIAGLTAKIEQATQQLVMTATPALLVAEVFDLRPSVSDDASSGVKARGATLTYDASVGTDDVYAGTKAIAYGGTLGLSIFSPQALFTSNGFANHGIRGMQGARLDSTLAFDDPANLRRLSFGDGITGSLDWSRAVRFGGVQFASDFSLRPQIVTTPLPDFFGEAAVPQSIDVYNGAAKVFEQDVEPGPFEIRNIPIVTGGGTATVVTRDVLGRETTQTISLYTNSSLLAPGLSRYAFDLGLMRQDYGIDSFGYAVPIATATVRRGITDHLTLEAHGEVSPHLALGGLGGTLSLGSLAGVSGALSFAGSTSGKGVLGSVALEARGGPFSWFGEITATDSDYRDLASLDGPLTDRLRAQFGLTTDFGRFGVVGLNWIRSEAASGDRTMLLSSSYSLSLGNGVYFGLSGLRDFRTGHWAVESFLSIPLNPGGLASTSFSNNNGFLTATNSASRPVDPDGGFGYRAFATLGDMRSVEGDVSWIGQHAQLGGGLSFSDAKIAVRGDAGGALVFLNGSIFATRDPGDAVALVKTGKPGVRVYRENRLVAVSDADGEALLPGLVPYAENHIGVETRDYPMSSIITEPDRKVAPRRRSGAIVDLAPPVQHAVLLTLVASSGKPLSLGSRVDIDGSGTPLVVGRDGQLFIADAKRDITASVTAKDGRCTFHVARPTSSGGAIAQIGPVTCAQARRAI
jgi:outer membrane usher protein